MSRSRLALALASALSLAACGGMDGSDQMMDDSFEYGAADVRAVTTGDFKGTATIAGRPTTALTLHLDQAPTSTTKAACSNRTLTHPLCISMSSMQLVGALSTADKAFEGVAVTGTFDAYGTKLTQGTLRVVAGATTFTFPWSDGKFGAGTVTDTGGTIGDATLGR